MQTRRTTRSRGHAAAQRLVKRMEANAFLEALYNAKILFSTAELLAWTVVIVLLSLAFERLFLWGLARVESVLLERSGT